MGWRENQTFVEVLQNIAILKNFEKFTEKDLCQGLFLKHPATLKEDSGTTVPFFKKHLFCRMAQGDCFCSLKKYSKKLTTRMLIK